MLEMTRVFFAALWECFVRWLRSEWVALKALVLCK